MAREKKDKLTELMEKMESQCKKAFGISAALYINSVDVDSGVCVVLQYNTQQRPTSFKKGKDISLINSTGSKLMEVFKKGIASMKMNVVDSDFELAVEHDGKSPYYFGYTFDWNDPSYNVVQNPANTNVTNS